MRMTLILIVLSATKSWVTEVREHTHHGLQSAAFAFSLSLFTVSHGIVLMKLHLSTS